MKLSRKVKRTETISQYEGRMQNSDMVGSLTLGTPPQSVVAATDARAGELTALVSAVVKGDRTAFDRMYQRFAPMVHGLLLARVPRDEVDDLVQDVFLQAFERLPTLREPGALGGWLATIARNRAADFYRRRPETEPVSPEHLRGSSTEAAAEAAMVLDRIRSLPEAYRETLVLRLVEGLTGPEIAELTGLTPDSVRVNLHRGMKLLREQLGMEVKHEPGLSLE
jgi:RNA polymerase sigma-70 factor (ECF subfamily)